MLQEKGADESVVLQQGGKGLGGLPFKRDADRGLDLVAITGPFSPGQGYKSLRFDQMPKQGTAPLYLGLCTSFYAADILPFWEQ